MTDIGPGLWHKVVSPGSIRRIGPGLWHKSGPMPPPAWHVALCGALVPVHAMNRDQRPSPGYKLIPSPLPFATNCWIVCEVWVLAFFFL
jgi:hypothetical protein